MSEFQQTVSTLCKNIEEFTGCKTHRLIEYFLNADLLSTDFLFQEIKKFQATVNVLNLFIPDNNPKLKQEIWKKNSESSRMLNSFILDFPGDSQKNTPTYQFLAQELSKFSDEDFLLVAKCGFDLPAIKNIEENMLPEKDYAHLTIIVGKRDKLVNFCEKVKGSLNVLHLLQAEELDNIVYGARP